MSYAVLAGNYVLNRCITSKRNITPFELWFNCKPNLNNLRVFGQQASVLKPDHHWGKFDTKGSMMYFVGYTDNHHTYKFYDPISKKFTISCDVAFTNQIGFTQVNLNTAHQSDTTITNLCVSSSTAELNKAQISNDDEGGSGSNSAKDSDHGNGNDNGSGRDSNRGNHGSSDNHRGSGNHGGNDNNRGSGTTEAATATVTGATEVI